ncbi:restriction endonuclease [Herminiimonas sp.]|uniref:restriction endonuclease n=1 Tax=Herminiimonas sp. TaxID=1926289 RepID=UPI002718E756|nr:restriction endonuclease [Herminiimonas sp.]MDO8305326.1 restriction endonuclease [Herminiimonas sp.]
MANTDWRDLEHLVAKIQRTLAPEATVQHNIKVMGRESEIERQIDVLVTQRIGQYTMTIAIDCKDYKSPIDVKGVEEFAGMVQDIGANKGVLVCPAGFTPTAKKRAKKLQMELYRPVDTDDHKWRVKPTIPEILEYVSGGMSFTLSCSYPGPLTISECTAVLEVRSSDGSFLGRPLDLAMMKWNAGEFPTEAGAYENLVIFQDVEVQIDNGHGGLAPVQITVNLQVTEERYFGQLLIDRVSGFLDEHTGLTITNSFSVGVIEPSEIQREWKKLAIGEEPPIKAVIGIRGLIGWQED